ncbi:MAG TPA: hypothetical protein PKK28_03490 [bacterium]|jgi:hypothetical protein|nr:hypothetical protein [bacterium]HNZ51711.1 hypothetical protein [bacterium]HOH85693.1 hypothetical protein [bacterium]
MKKRKTRHSAFNLRPFIIVLLVVLTVCCLWLVGKWLMSAHRFNKNSADYIINHNATTTNQPTEYFSSFSDLFSGTAWFDSDKTSLIRDPSAMVFTFKPNIELTDLGNCSALNKQCRLIDSQSDINQACIKDQCLTIKNGRLFYRQKRVDLPIDGQTELLNLSVNSINDRWLIGGVQKLADKDYRPLAWLFDGKELVAVDLLDHNHQPAHSQYLGYLAAAGQADSFLVLYSAYEGLAWQINGSEVRDLSHFFGIRINAGGFRPKIIYTGHGKNITWYVFNQAEQPIRWLKFWQNGTDWIEGVLDLSNRWPTDSQAVYFAIHPGTNNLQAKVTNNQGQSHLWSVNDLGFISSNNDQIVSVNLTSYDQIKPRIVGAVIAGAWGGWSGFEQAWSLSDDGQHWQAVNIGERLNFSKPVEQLWWRWQVGPSADQWRSPCLKMITLNYFRL